MDGTAAETAGIARSAMAKASWRILPLILLSYLVAFMDRSNISFASLQMNVDLGFSATIYGLGAGLFFVGYSIFEVPSNLLLARFGARRWIARIMLTWGLISGGLMFVQTPMQFYVMRFLLGVAEAGFYPGVLLYLSLWFPNAWRGRAISRFYIASPLAVVLMGSLAGPLLGLGGTFGLAGWQWLFLAEGVPSVVLAVVLLFVLPDSPESARWLTPAEKAWLTGALAHDVAASGAVHHGFLRALTHPMVLTIGVVDALVFACTGAVQFSAPKLLVAATGWSAGQVGWLTALGGVLSTAAMLFLGWNSDRKRERYLHLAAIIGLTGASIAGLALAGGPLTTVLAYLGYATFALPVGVIASCLVADTVHPQSRAVSFAAMNTIAQVGAFIGPLLWGMAADRTGSFRLALSVIPVVLALAIWIVLHSRSASVASRARLVAAVPAPAA
jgi:ACS family tartrate transporter-like MFS transporter